MLTSKEISFNISIKMHIKCNVFQFLYQCISLDMALCFFVLHSTLRVSLAEWILGKMERKKNERTFWNMFNWEEKKKCGRTQVFST